MRILFSLALALCLTAPAFAEDKPATPDASKDSKAVEDKGKVAATPKAETPAQKNDPKAAPTPAPATPAPATPAPATPAAPAK